MTDGGNDKRLEDYEFIAWITPITKGPLGDRRKKIRRAFIEEALRKYPADKTFDVGELSGDVRTLTDCTMTDESIVSILEELKDEGIVMLSAESMKYIVRKEIQTLDFDAMTQDAWKEFERYLATQYKDYDPFLDEGARTAFDKIILLILIKFYKSSISLADQKEVLPIDDFKAEINKEIKKQRMTPSLSKKYAQIFYNFIYSKPPVLSKLIFDRYLALVNVDLLLRESEMPDINFEDDVKFLLADTSFLVGLLADTDPIHPLTIAVVTQCMKCKIPIYYSARTKDEMIKLIFASKSEMSGLGSPKKGPVVRNQFVQDFRRRNDISWNDYFITLTKWEAIVKLQWNILPEPEGKIQGMDKDVYEIVQTLLPALEEQMNDARMRADPSYQPRQRTEALYEHDAQCMGKIAYYKKHQSDDVLVPIGPWFITFDKVLASIDTTISKRYGHLRFVILPRTLLNYLLVYSKITINSEDVDRIAEAIIKYTAKEPDDLIPSFDEYLRLVTYKSGMSQSELEVVKKIFLTSPLLDQLKEAISNNIGGEADEISSKILNDEARIDQILEARKDKEKIKSLLNTLRENHDEMARMQAKIDAYESVPRQTINVVNVNNVDVSVNLKIEPLMETIDVLKGNIDRLGLDPVGKNTIMQNIGMMEAEYKTGHPSARVLGEYVKNIYPVLENLAYNTAGNMFATVILTMMAKACGLG